jgi:RHS repeat-associated protein
MSANRKTLLCRYHYDPLDRLADCTPSAQAHTQRFYLKERLTSEIQGSVQRSIFQQDDQLLAQQQRQDGVIETTLLATDQQRSVLHALDATQPHPLAYTPYGHGPAENGLLSLLGFNGERPDPVTGHYLLGNGYRAFNPVLMRFNSPDSWSPFDEGGVNAYVYCLGDPVNMNDPTGHVGNLWKGIKNLLNMRTPSPIITKTVTNHRQIVPGLDIFDDIKHGKTRLNVNLHGAIKDGKFTAFAGNHPISAKNLHEGLIRQKVNFNDYDSIALLICHSADTKSPFGQEFANLTKKPVKAFSGPVRVTKTYASKSWLEDPDLTTIKGYHVHKKRKPYKFKGRTYSPYKSVKFNPVETLRET